MMREILSYTVAQTPDMVHTLRQMVEIESPSTEPAAVNRLADFVAAQLTQLQASVERIPVAAGGDIVRARYGQGERPIMMLGHLDTVWPLGTLAQRPVRIENDRLFGPGSFDMKGGLTVALHTLRTLAALRLTPPRPLTFLFTPQEETGGKAYRPRLEAEARQSQCVLVLEPPMPGGAVKTARKGAGKIILQARGRAAHAGLAPQQGVSAITELAHQIVRVAELNEADRGITVNVGVIRGGLHANVVADEASAEIDFRFPTLASGQQLVAAIHQLKPVLEGARLEVSGGISAPPLERTDAVVGLYQAANKVATELGFDLPEASAGGASEGCYTAAVGTPTLDGLGPDGDGAHALQEHVLIRSLPQRTALLTGLILTLGQHVEHNKPWSGSQ
jgi:glutamate carboxypeptidase